MKIRAKLLLLIIAIFLLLSSTALFYFINNDVSRRIESERANLTALTMAVDRLTIALNEVTRLQFHEKTDAFQAAREGLNLAFNNLQKITTISSVNAEVKKALQVINELKKNADLRLDAFFENYNKILADSKILFMFPNSHTILDFYTSDYTDDRKQFFQSTGLDNLTAFFQTMDIAHQTLMTSKRVINEQFDLIDKEVIAVQAKAAGFAITIASLVFVLTFLISILFANRIARRVISIERHIANMKNGDLTKKAVTTAHDEIGDLSKNLNLFTESLSMAIREISEVSHENIKMKDTLIQISTEAMIAATEIDANTGSINNQIREVDRRVLSSVNSIELIVKNIATLLVEIAGQSTMTEQSAASVTNMIAALENMSSITNRDRQSVEELVRVTEHGRGVFEEANIKIAQIPEYISTIQEMAVVINHIASQTNLLAMNAAIEAAHAGDSGKGFAVVADEIRKLSEASTSSSRDISESIKSIVEMIESASLANSGTSEAFKAIEEKIRVVAASLNEMFRSINDIQTGGQQILTAMDDLRQHSAKVNAEAFSMDNASQEIRISINDLNRISSEVSGNMSEIAIGVTSVTDAIRNITDMSEAIGAGSTRLDEEVSRFSIN